MPVVVSVNLAWKIRNRYTFNRGKSLLGVVLLDKALNGFLLIFRRCRPTLKLFLELSLEVLVIMLIRFNG